MILGAIVVVVVGILIFNYFKNINQGQITETAVEETSQPKVEIVEKDGQQFAKGLPTTYTVAKGDHLWGIAENFYNSGYNWVDIAKANNLKNANLIETGQQLIVPDVAVKLATVESSPQSASAIGRSDSGGSAIDGNSYTTIKGDYLWDIAVRAYGDGYAWVNLYNANKTVIGNNPNLLFTGVNLTLPR